MRRFADNQIIIGVDEVGRGSLVGNVVASACIIHNSMILTDINDSKAISRAKRNIINDQLFSQNNYIGIGSASISEIEQYNILQATMLAMTRAIDNVLINIQDHTNICIIIDGQHVPKKYSELSIPCIKGDTMYIEIAAASIIAKVHRDKYMAQLHQLAPLYGWDQNMGYGTTRHIDAIRMHGVSIYHRHSFLTKILKSFVV